MADPAVNENVSHSCCRLNTDADGQHSLVASQRCKTGTLLLNERACVNTVADDGILITGAARHRNQSVHEWKLVRLLLKEPGLWSKIKDKPFAVASSSHVKDGDHTTYSYAIHQDGQKLVKWLKEQGISATLDDAIRAHEIVAANAFSIDSFVLDLQVGAGFYESAAMFNHSCEPNALTVRTAERSLTYAIQDIDDNEELVHSYRPLWMLAMPLTIREQNLPFQCRCSRCVRERASGDPLADLYYPFNASAKTAESEAVGMFKMTYVVGGPEQILEAGDKMFALCFSVFERHPCAALDATCFYLNAFVQLCAMHKTVYTRANYAKPAVRLHAQACAALVEAYPSVEAFKVLRALADLVSYIFGAELRSVLGPRLQKSVRLLAALFGPSPDTLLQLDGLFLLRLQDQLPGPSLEELYRCLVDASDVEDPLSELTGFHQEICSYCNKQEEQVGSFPRCSRCRLVRYCSAEHQKADWRVHKRTCQQQQQQQASV